MKKLLSILLTMLLCFLAIAPTSAYAATIKLTKTSLTLYEGNTYSLKLTGTTKTVSWKSSDKSIATVSSKGKVTAVKAGQATITATASSKKYTCKLTVKEPFSAKKALNNMITDVTDTGSGLIVILENKYLYDFSVKATAVYYDENGNMLGKSTAENYYFESGSRCALEFYGLYDSNYKDVPYSDYKISYTIEKVSEYTKSCLKDIKIDSNYGADNVMVEVTNDGEQSTEFTEVCIVFYKDGIAIDYDYTYADVQSPGSIAYLEFSFPYDENYNTIQPDDYQVFVNNSLYYDY